MRLEEAKQLAQGQTVCKWLNQNWSHVCATQSLQMNHYDEICPGMEVAREEVLSLMLRAWIQRGDIHSGF